MAVTLFARLNTGEVVDLLRRQMERYKAAIFAEIEGGGAVYGGSLEMMSTQQWTGEDIIICPLHQPFSNRFDRSTHGGIVIDGVFDLYFRHRDMFDEAKGSDIWLRDYYKVLAVLAEKFIDWWPIEWEGVHEGKRMTIEPINARMLNEPRKSWRDNGIGEGMLELQCSYILNVPIEPLQG